MSDVRSESERDFVMPAWWRIFVIAAATLILCSCRSVWPVSFEPDEQATAVEEDYLDDMDLSTQQRRALRRAMKKRRPEATPSPAPLDDDPNAIPVDEARFQNAGATSLFGAVQQASFTSAGPSPQGHAVPSHAVHPHAAPYGYNAPHNFARQPHPYPAHAPMLMHGMSPQYAAPPILVPGYGPGAWDVPRQPWSPPGIARPWPRDEYIFDGGDNGRDTSVGTDWTVYGLDQEDTIGHFDTLDGDTVVVPTNRVPVYAPRFAAVRKISGITLHRETELAAAVNTDTRLDQRGHYQIASTTLQREQLEGWIGSRSADTFRDLTRGLGVHGTRMLAEFRNKFLPYEDFQIIRMGAFENSEKARLAKSIDAALVWEEAAAVQVVVKGEEAVVSRGSSRPEETARAESQGKPRMHIVKVASRSYANPGDVIDFTIRFDNTGTQKIGNVTVIDNLTRRLEYVPDSAQCSVQADFFTQENEGESLVLRWEIIEPMNPGEGGIIRFQCRVR